MLFFQIYTVTNLYGLQVLYVNPRSQYGDEVCPSSLFRPTRPTVVFILLAIQNNLLHYPRHAGDDRPSSHDGLQKAMNKQLRLHSNDFVA